MNKSAREMFEELGFGYDDYGGCVICGFEKLGCYSNIVFDKEDKNIELYGTDRNHWKFNIPLIKAIRKQLEELGWLEDKEAPMKPTLETDRLEKEQ